MTKRVRIDSPIHDNNEYGDMPKLVDPNWTHVSVLVDTSGSMESLNPENTSKQLTGLISEQTGGQVTVTVARFSDKYEIFLNNVNAKDVKITAQDIRPDGSTALYESFCKMIEDVDKFIDGIDTVPNKIVIIVLTDGEENASTGKYANSSGRELLNSKIKTKQEKDNWIFYFLGTNIDAIKTGTDFGIPRETCINYGSSETGCTNVLRSTSQALNRVRQSQQTNYRDILRDASFTGVERTQSSQH